MCSFKTASIIPLAIERIHETVTNTNSELLIQEARGADPKTTAFERFTRIADTAAEIQTGRQPLLSTLLDSVLPVPSEPFPDLQPIWANEAMQRAYDIVELVASLEQVRPSRNANRGTLRSELDCALDLASVYRDLQTVAGCSPQACAGALGGAVGSIAGLFCAVSGIREITCQLQDIALDSVRRRALVLVASRLLMSMLTPGEIVDRDVDVRLMNFGSDAACLSVVANSEALRQCDDIVADLAEILNAALLRTRCLGQAKVTLIFPVDRKSGSHFARHTDSWRASGCLAS